MPSEIIGEVEEIERFVDVIWDERAKVWVASGDLTDSEGREVRGFPGLVAEAKTEKEMIGKLRQRIPEVAKLNNFETPSKVRIHWECDDSLPFPRPPLPRQNVIYIEDHKGRSRRKRS